MRDDRKLEREVAVPGSLSRDNLPEHRPNTHDRTRQHLVTHTHMAVEEEVMTLAELDGTQLRRRWQHLTDSPAPGVSPKLLRLALAWRMQADVLGGLSSSARRKLAQAAGGKSTTRPAGAGTRLVREWQGVVHVVAINEKGVIRWNNREWKSLSAAARGITGGHWSGPAFFGLRKAAQQRAHKPDVDGAGTVRQEPSPKASSSKIVTQGQGGMK